MAGVAEPSLNGLFNQAKAQQDELDSLDPRSAKFKDTLQAIIDNLQACQQLIQQISLFSVNEEVEDISTQDLRYVDHRLVRIFACSRVFQISNSGWPPSRDQD